MSVHLEIRGLHVEFGGEPHQGWLPPGAATPLPTPVERATLNLQIEESAAGFILEWWDEQKKHCGDTWHQTLDDAMAQAETYFGVTRAMWKDKNF
ncbi:MAG: hypothetical protein NTX87_01255 [Planctomycetota bacterium]|nr:hypothetical protein [Planctomycetota bacterium]